MTRLLLLLVFSVVSWCQVPATNLTASCPTPGTQVNVNWKPLSKGRIFVRIDTNPPGVAWPPSPAFIQSEVTTVQTSITFPSHSDQAYVVYITSLESDGSWPLTDPFKLTCASAPVVIPPPPVTPPVSMECNSASCPFGNGFYFAPLVAGGSQYVNVDFSMSLVVVPAPSGPGPCPNHGTQTNITAFDLVGFQYFCVHDTSGPGFHWGRSGFPLLTTW